MIKPKIIAEIGVCWGGDFQLAKRYIEVAAAAHVDFVKFQTRDVYTEVPKDQWDVMRVPPWGGEPIRYIEYRERMEFTDAQYDELSKHCKERNIEWSTSVWGIKSFERMSRFDLPWLKIPSCKLTNNELMEAAASWSIERQKPLLVSTGMSTREECVKAADILKNIPRDLLIIFNCNSSYPTQTHELNLSAINDLKSIFNCPVGLSSHSVTLGTTVAATYLGYSWLEVHITHDRSLPGDHSSAVSFHGLFKLVSGVNDLIQAYGGGTKTLYDSEIPFRKKLRGV